MARNGNTNADRLRRAITWAVVGCLALVFAFAGFGGAAPPPVHAPREPVPVAVPFAAPAGETAPGSVRVGSGGAGGGVDRREADPLPAELEASVRFVRRLGEAPGERHFTGRVEVFADGRRVGGLDVVNRDPVRVALPTATRRVRFETPGWLPVEVDAQPVGRPEWSLGDVRFEPAAGVRLTFANLPMGFHGRAELALLAETESCTGSLPDAGAVVAPVRLGFLSGMAFEWRAQLLHRDGGSVFALAGREHALQPGEEREVRLDFAAVQPRRFQLTGVSPRLLPHLPVHCWQPGAGLVRWLRVRPGADGSFAVAAEGPLQFEVQLPDVHVPLAPVTADSTLLRPERALLGVRLLHEGKPLASRLRMSDGRARELAEVHVVARERLGERFRMTTDVTGPLSFSSALLPAAGDFVELDAALADRLGAVVVTLRGEPPRDLSVTHQLQLQLLRDDGTAARTAVVTQPTVRFDALEPRHYTLRWACHGVPLQPALAQVVVAAGAEAHAAMEWLPLVEWNGEVVGHRDMPAAQRFAFVCFGGNLLPRPSAGIGEDGRFALRLPPGFPMEPAELCAKGMARVPAVVGSMDTARRHLVLRPVSGTRWVTLRVEQVGDAPWLAMLHREGTLAPPHAVVWRDEQRPVVVPGGARLPGVLYTGMGANSRVAAWFSLDGSADSVVLRPAAGRTITVRAATRRSDRRALLVGPQGQLSMDRDLPGDEPQSWFVPEGTRAFGVWIPADGPTSLREIPLPAGGELVVD